MKKLFTLFLAILFATNNYAQKPKVKDGNFKNLKDISAYNLVFDYTDVKIPKYDSEEEFLKDKMEKREKKATGSGELFKTSWFRDREERYEPKFIESFNKRFKNNKITVGKNLNSSKYTMKVHTTKLYPGYNVGVWRQNAEISATITIFETANPNNILVSAKIKDVQGKGAFGNDYNSGYRISECYAKLAKILAKTIKKKAK